MLVNNPKEAVVCLCATMQTGSFIISLWTMMSLLSIILSLIVAFLIPGFTRVTSMTLIHYVWLVTLYQRRQRWRQKSLISWGCLATTGLNCSYLFPFRPLHIVFSDNCNYLWTRNYFLAQILILILDWDICQILSAGNHTHLWMNWEEGLSVHCIFSAYRGTAPV